MCDLEMKYSGYQSENIQFITSKLQSHFLIQAWEALWLLLLKKVLIICANFFRYINNYLSY